MDMQLLNDLPFQAVTALMAHRLLGPSVDYLAGRSRELTEKMVSNIENIFLNAQKKLGHRIQEPGQVPPRVLRGIMNEGAFCEDKLAAEYLGGVLASSRGDSRRDDRGVVMNAMISRLSVYQLRAHYVVYHAIKDLFDGAVVQRDGASWHGVEACMPIMAFLVAMGFHKDEIDVISADTVDVVPGIVEHTFFGLRNEGLIAGFQYKWGDDGHVDFWPSVGGVELFMWAYGYGSNVTDTFFAPGVQFESSEDVLLVPGYMPLHLQDPHDSPKIIDGYRYRSYAGQRCNVKRDEHLER